MANARFPLAAGAVAVLALAACHRSPPPLQPLPLSEAGPTPLTTAPAADALPAAPPAPIRRLAHPRYAYAWPERAWAVSDVFYDSPPDWAFDYDGVEPWVWRTDDGYWRVVEWVPGGQRVYYFAPGWNEPYFVADPDYSYAFDRGALVMVYDRTGAVLDPLYVPQRADDAGRYLRRAQALYRAAGSAPRVPVARADWSLRGEAVALQRTRWESAAAHDPALAVQRDANLAAERGHWAAERARRASYAAIVDRRIGDPAAARRAEQRAQIAQADARAVRGPFGGSPRLAAVSGGPPQDRRRGLFGFGPHRQVEADRQGEPDRQAASANPPTPAPAPAPTLAAPQSRRDARLAERRAERAAGVPRTALQGGARNAMQAARDSAFQARADTPHPAAPTAQPRHGRMGRGGPALQAAPPTPAPPQMRFEHRHEAAAIHGRAAHGDAPPVQAPSATAQAASPGAHGGGNPHGDNRPAGGQQRGDEHKHGH